eukprot:1278856-Rhodomonas_salina.1
MPVLTRSRAAALATAPQPAEFCCADPNPRRTRKRSFYTAKGYVHYAKVQEVNGSLCFPADFNLQVRKALSSRGGRRARWRSYPGTPDCQ